MQLCDSRILDAGIYRNCFCTQCGACAKACPMDIDIPEYVKNGQRVFSTECISCLTCTSVCPQSILKYTFKMDMGGKEILRRRGSGP